MQCCLPHGPVNAFQSAGSSSLVTGSGFRQAPHEALFVHASWPSNGPSVMRSPSFGYEA